jgi:hypothetical protein
MAHIVTALPSQQDSARPLERGEAIAAIREALQRRSGKAWSVTGGRGSAWHLLFITSPPRRCVDGLITREDRIELSTLLAEGERGGHRSGVTVWDWEEYVARARGEITSPPARHLEEPL